MIPLTSELLLGDLAEGFQKYTPGTTSHFAPAMGDVVNW